MIKWGELSDCHWHDFKCTNGNQCRDCEHQPADDDKPNGRQPARNLNWVSGYQDEKIPVCPACGAATYSLERCIFCGQKFLPDERTEELKKPPETVRKTCPVCGGETMIGTHSRYNGHFHGKCEKCGARMLE